MTLVEILVGIGFLYFAIGAVLAYGAYESGVGFGRCVLLFFFWMPMIAAGAVISMFKKS
jgi:hypothetical protein